MIIKNKIAEWQKNNLQYIGETVEESGNGSYVGSENFPICDAKTYTIDSNYIVEDLALRVQKYNMEDPEVQQTLK